MRFLIFAVLMLCQSAYAQKGTLHPGTISMAVATSVTDALPFDMLAGKGKWSPDPKASFVKLHMHFASAVYFDELEVESCGRSFDHSLQAFVNFDQGYQILPPGAKTTRAMFGAPGRGMAADSLTINFLHNTELCISGVRLKRGTSYIPLIPPKVVPGTVTASSTLKPVEAYDIMNLFDSRFEYAWASEGKPTGVEFNFAFPQEQSITKIKIWNGYQRSENHCYSNARVKEFEISGDGAYAGAPVKVQVEDEMGERVIELPKEFKGKTFKLTATKAHAGKAYKDLVISEMRFFDGKDWVMLDPLQRAREIAKTNRTSFESAKLASILNQGLVGTTKVSDSEGSVTLRFRDDGSMYFESNVADEEASNQLYALGNYEVKKADPKFLEVRLFGLLRKNTYGYEDMDCNGCGRACNTKGVPNNESIFQETIKISPAADGRFAVENLSKKPKLMFKKIEMQFEKAAK